MPSREPWPPTAGATAISALTLAKQVDRRGAVETLQVGLLVVLVGVVGSAFATSWVMLSAWQALCGLGAGMSLPACYAAATRLDRHDENGRTLSRVLTGWSISLVAGVPSAAWIAELSDWRVSYAPLVALVLFAGVGSWKLRGRKSLQKGGRKRCRSR